MNRHTTATRPDDSAQTGGEPHVVAVIGLRGASLALSYGLLLLTQWLWTFDSLATPLGVCLAFVTTILCAFFIFLGVMADGRTVARVWRAMGKAVLYIVMFT